MRTTLDLDDDVLAAARALAVAEGRSLGAVISDLAKRGLRPRPREGGDFPVFEVPDDAPPLTIDAVRRALDE